MWFDSHCHLNLPGFGAAPEEVWSEAQNGGVSRVFVPGVDPSEWGEATWATQPGMSTGVGLHPFTLERWAQDDELSRVDVALTQLERAARSRQHVAIGECGWDKPLALRCPRLSLDYQTSIVTSHLQLAAELDLPIVLHVVHAHGLALETLKRFRLRRGGIVHCFSGHAELVATYCRLGFSLGYGTQLVRPNADKARAALRTTPLERIVLETDAPWHVTRGRLPNSPLAVIDVAHIVSRALGLPLEVLAELTFANASGVLSEPLGSTVSR